MDGVLKRPGELVDCWDDDERMDFLFSSFPAEPSTNPEHWRSKLEFWTGLIVKLCENSTSVCIDINMMASWLERNGRRPMGLQVVWEAMLADRSLVSAQEFVGDMARNSSWVGWGLNTFVRKPTLWMAGKMLSPLKALSPAKTQEQNKSYICAKSFKVKCEKLMRTLYHSTSSTHGHLHIVSLREVAGLAESIVSGAKDLEILLLALERDKKVVVFNKSDDKNSEKFIKFAKNSNECVTPVNEGDMGVVKLAHTKQALEKQISILYTKQDDLLATAKGFVRSGERNRAKMTLRQKQRISLNINRKVSSLDNIEQLLLRLEQCGTDQMVMDAYKAGVSAHKEATKGMTIDDVDTTIDDVQAAIDDHEQITSTLATSFYDDILADDLEQELEDLLAGDGAAKNQTDSDVTKVVSGPLGDVTQPSYSEKSRGDETVSSQTDADIAKLVTGMAATNLREVPAQVKSVQKKRTSQALH